MVVEEPENADCLLINTCSFLTEAVEESLDRIVELAQFKKDGGPGRLVVTGCLVSRYGDQSIWFSDDNFLIRPERAERILKGVAERGLKYLQTGFAQSYMFVMLLGAILLVGYLLRGL